VIDDMRTKLSDPFKGGDDPDFRAAYARFQSHSKLKEAFPLA
jgi:hypothetical protein